MGHLGELYREGRERFLSVVAHADPDAPVPTCPIWSVKNVLSHVAGIPADILAGRLDGVATEPWTAAQVDARRDRTIAEIAAEWRETGPQIDAMIDSFGPTGKQLLFDLTSHEQDVRCALGEPALRDAAALDVSLDFIALGRSAMGALPQPLRLEADGRSWQIGEGPGAILRATRFDLVRAFSGRRSHAQIRAMDWSTDPTPFLPMFTYGPFAPPADDIVEV